MKKITALLLTANLLLTVVPPKYRGSYQASSSFGPHSWHQRIKINATSFSSEEWRTGFFDFNNQLTTGIIEVAGDTLILVPRKISFHVPFKPLKYRRPLYLKKTCNCATFVADTSTIKNYKLNRRKTLSQELCKRGYKLIMAGDSLVMVQQLAPGKWLKTGFRKMVKESG